MQQKLSLFLLMVFSGLCLLSQSTTDYYYDRSQFTNGIYKSYEEFLNNEPSIQKEIIKKSADIYIWDEALQKEVFVDPNKVWGYSQNDNIYVSYENAYWRLINTGKLNHFSAIVIHRYQTFDPYGFALERETQALIHLFFDIETGVIEKLNQRNLEVYFEDDPQFKRYFRKLKGNKEEKLIIALRAFNDRYPIVLPYKK